MGYPWEGVPLSGEAISAIPGMIQPCERQLLYWLGSKAYGGSGEIVELGSFFGASTEALAKGLAANTRVTEKAGRIHCHDLFECDAALAAAYRPWLEPFGLGAGDSFLPVFRRNTAAYADMITGYPGDLFRRGWSGRPIEVLFIDMAVSWTMHDHIVRRFFRSLMPGRSFVVQQDFLYQDAPWIAVTMAAFDDWFDLIGNADTSLVFRLRRPLPDALVEAGTQGLPGATKLALMDKAIGRLTTANSPVWAILSLGRALLLLDVEGRDAAERQIDAVLAGFDHPMSRERAAVMRRRIAAAG